MPSSPLLPSTYPIYPSRPRPSRTENASRHRQLRLYLVHQRRLYLVHHSLLDSPTQPSNNKYLPRISPEEGPSSGPMVRPLWSPWMVVLLYLRTFPREAKLLAWCRTACSWVRAQPAPYPLSCSVPCRLHLPAADPEVGSGAICSLARRDYPLDGTWGKGFGPASGRPLRLALAWSLGPLTPVDTKDRTRCDGGSLKEPQGNPRADERKNRTRVGGNLMS